MITVKGVTKVSLLESKLREGGSHGLFLLHFSPTQNSSEEFFTRESMDEWFLHDCVLTEILRKIIFARAVFYEEGPSFSLDSQRGQWLHG